MYACEKNSTSSPALVSKQDLFEKAEFLSKLLRLEFIYKPSPTINETFDNTISFMIRRFHFSCLFSFPIKKKLKHFFFLKKRNVFEQSSEDNYCVNENPPNEESGGTFVYLFLCSLFWPFIDSYWLASACLLRLLPNRMLDEKTWIRFVQEVGERLYFEGLIDLYEAISHDTLNNALVLFESWKMIQFINIEGQPSQPGKRVIQLTPEVFSFFHILFFKKKLKKKKFSFEMELKLKHSLKNWESTESMFLLIVPVVLKEGVTTMSLMQFNISKLILQQQRSKFG